jgi:hypothetical protein
MELTGGVVLGACVVESKLFNSARQPEVILQ